LFRSNVFVFVNMMTLRVSALVALGVHTAFGVENSTQSKGQCVVKPGVYPSSQNKTHCKNIGERFGQSKCIDLIYSEGICKWEPAQQHQTVQTAQVQQHGFYWEHQVRDQCAKHALNAIFQGPEFDPAKLNKIGDKLAQNGGFTSGDLICYKKNPIQGVQQGLWNGSVIDKALEERNYEVVEIKKMEESDAVSRFHQAIDAVTTERLNSATAVVVGQNYGKNYGHWYTLRRSGDNYWYNLNSMGQSEQQVQTQAPMDLEGVKRLIKKDRFASTVRIVSPQQPQPVVNPVSTNNTQEVTTKPVPTQALDPTDLDYMNPNPAYLKGIAAFGNTQPGCPKCTFVNKPGAETCEMCNAALDDEFSDEEVKVEEKARNCPACTFLNQPGAEMCEICQTPLP